jgi:hypothetical protein
LINFRLQSIKVFYRSGSCDGFEPEPFVLHGLTHHEVVITSALAGEGLKRSVYLLQRTCNVRQGRQTPTIDEIKKT